MNERFKIARGAAKIKYCGHSCGFDGDAARLSAFPTAIPNNREIASVVWIGIFFSLAMLKKDLRSSFGGNLRIALNPAIVTVLALFAIDVFARRIVTWRASASLPTEFVLDNVEQASYDCCRDAPEARNHLMSGR